MLGIPRLQPSADPAAHGVLEGDDVDAAEDARVGRLAEPASAGEAQRLKEGPAAFFASAASDWVTGALLPVDGGYLAE